MRKHIVGLRIVYGGGLRTITPLGRTDRGTRIMLPGTVEVVANQDPVAVSIATGLAIDRLLAQIPGNSVT